MVRFSLLAYIGRSALVRHRLSSLLITFVLCAPMLHADLNISTQAKTLLSSPSTPPTFKPDFHGVLSTFHDTIFGKNNTNQEEREGDNHKAKIRMNAEMYPRKDVTPDVNSPQVQAWINEIDWSKVPNIPVAPQHPEVKHFPLCPPQGQENKAACWWSCTGCVTKTDVITCPNSDAWGLTYDDGPSLASRSMMKHLSETQLTATFFIVGSRVLEYPDILREQVVQGHHLGMHSKEAISLFFFSAPGSVCLAWLFLSTSFLISFNQHL